MIGFIHFVYFCSRLQTKGGVNMKLKRYTLLVPTLMLWASTAYSATATVSVGFPGQTTALPAGATEAVLYSPSTIAVTTGDATTVPPLQTPGTQTPTTSFSANVFFSPYLKVYSVPLSYTLFGNFKTTVTIPYIQRTIKKTVTPTTTTSGVTTLGAPTERSYSVDGLGDLGLSFDYSWLLDEIKEFSTDISFTLPTGDIDAKSTVNGTTQTVPLGIGAVSLAANQHASYYLWDNKARVFGTVGLKYCFPTDYYHYEMPKGATTHLEGQLHEEKGLSLSAMAGAEYFFMKNFSATGRFSVVQVFEGKTNFQGDGLGLRDSNDSLLASDFSATIKYRFWGNTAFGLTGIFPVFTLYDNDVTAPEARSWGINFNLTQYFF